MLSRVSPKGSFWLIVLNGIIIVAVFLFLYVAKFKLIWPFGWIWFGSILLIASWYLLDGIIPRRSIYRGFDRSEPYLKFELRFWRAIALLALALAGIAVTLVAVLGGPQPGIPIPEKAATPLAAITTAFLASFGWLFTRFESGKSDRAKATLDAVKTQLYDSHLDGKLKRILSLVSKYREVHSFKEAKPLPSEAIDAPLSIYVQDMHPSGTRRLTLRPAVNDFFNALNQIALGVRQGELDHRTVELLLRSRYIPYNYIFFEYIAKATAAEPQPNGRWRAQNRTWEHMLWLTSKLPMLASDGTDWEHIVMPPDHIIGIRPGELVRPPKRDHRHPLLPDLAIVSDAWKRQDEARLNAVFPRIPPR